MPPQIVLVEVPKTDFHLRRLMAVHYSHPKGFVGRSLCYLVVYDDASYGAIVGGSATLHLPGRNEFLGINKKTLGQIVNNIFYHVEKINGKYPFRNFTVEVLKTWRNRVAIDWARKYHEDVLGYESLVELPRTGELYLRDGWDLVGQTIGYTCKRTSGKGTDSWGGKRVWNTKELRPKHVFCKRRESCGIGLDQSIAGMINTSFSSTETAIENYEDVGSLVQQPLFT